MAKKGPSTKQRVLAHVAQLGTSASGIVCKDKSNKGPALFEMFVWQEVIAYAKQREEEAYREATVEGVIPEEDELRAKPEGEHIVVESDEFSFVVHRKKPRRNLDLESFTLALVRKFKLDPEAVTKLIAEHYKPGKPVLEQKVLEA